jgi:hypothetical protein
MVAEDETEVRSADVRCELGGPCHQEMRFPMNTTVKTAHEQERALIEMTADEQRGVVGGIDAEDIPFCGNGFPHWPLSGQSLTQQVVLPATSLLTPRG